jgi:sterol desaturase/sphingolipid hydroxylase (fatty acid hydroxylase superfamily)
MGGWLVAACAACAVFERRMPGWRLPEVSGWGLQSALLALAQMLAVGAAGCYWDLAWHGASVFELSDRLAPWSAALVAYVAATFVFYWWHRARHASDVLWRLFHQVHHSARRLEAATAFYKHPLEMVVDCMLGGAIAYAVFGLEPAAGALFALYGVAVEVFYHANFRTPAAIGYLIQRPEAHRIHHELGRHCDNYGDLAVWDLAFGTWNSPARWEGECGFVSGVDASLAPMLAFHDAHEARRAP